MILPYEYPDHYLLISTHGGSFIAAHKTQAECVEFWQSFSQRAGSCRAWNVTVLDEDTYSLLRDEYVSFGHILE